MSETPICDGPKIRFNTTRWDIYWGLIFGIPSTRGIMFLWPAIWLWRTYANVKDVFSIPDVSLLLKLQVFFHYALLEGLYLALVLLVVYSFMAMVVRKGGIICEHTLSLGDEGLQEVTHVNRQWRSYREFKTMRKIAGFWVVRGISSTHFIFRDAGLREGNPADFARALNEHVTRR